MPPAAPVVDESHPTYSNLIGKIERRAHLGVMYTDFTEIRAGAMLQANGGYLILQALDLPSPAILLGGAQTCHQNRSRHHRGPGGILRLRHRWPAT